MITVKVTNADGTPDFELEIKSRKIALDIREQLKKQGIEAKVIKVEEIS